MIRRSAATFAFCNPLTCPVFETVETRRHLSASTVVKGFTQTNLVSDGAIAAKFTDANLKNAWGLAFNPGADVIWTSDAGTGLSSAYNTDGSTAQTGFYSTINIPKASGSGQSVPTGIVFNKTSHFLVHNGSKSGAATYLWATVDGAIDAWNYNVSPTDARVVVNRASSGASFTGLTLSGSQIYATDFHSGTVDVFNSKYQAVDTTGQFVDPKLPTGYAPFGISTIGGNLYVTYAKQDSNRQREVAGVGNGFVDVFTSGGKLVEHLATGGLLNAPWGVVQAPRGFGKLGGDILVGNFGDGKILAFNPNAPAVSRAVGVLGSANHTLAVDGLWGMSFGDTPETADSLFLTAGPHHETDGLLAVISA